MCRVGNMSCVHSAHQPIEKRTLTDKSILRWNDARLPESTEQILKWMLGHVRNARVCWRCWEVLGMLGCWGTGGAGGAGQKGVSTYTRRAVLESLTLEAWNLWEHESIFICLWVSWESIRDWLLYRENRLSWSQSRKMKPYLFSPGEPPTRSSGSRPRLLKVPPPQQPHTEDQASSHELLWKTHLDHIQIIADFSHGNCLGEEYEKQLKLKLFFFKHQELLAILYLG